MTDPSAILFPGSTMKPATGPPPAEELEQLLSESPAEAKARAASAFDRAAEGAPVVLYGAGGFGRQLEAVLKRLGRPAAAIADGNPAVQGTTVDGRDVLSPGEAARRYGDSCPFVVAVYNPWVPYAAISRSLRDFGCRRVCPFPPLAWKYPDELLPNYAIDLPHKVLESADAVRAAFALLADDNSRREYVDQVRVRVTGEFAHLAPPSGREQYFLPDLPLLGERPVFVDCGAFDGDSLIQFVRHCPDEFEKAIALEPDPSNFAKLGAVIAGLSSEVRTRVKALPCATGAARGTVRFTSTGLASASVSVAGDVEVECVTLDELLKDDRPTYVKMDIEGAEPATLQGSRETLRRSRPALAISLYHLQDHLWSIPLAVRDLCPDYEFRVERHNCDIWDLVLYAVPRERRR